MSNPLCSFCLFFIFSVTGSRFPSSLSEANGGRHGAPRARSAAGTATSRRCRNRDAAQKQPGGEPGVTGDGPPDRLRSPPNERPVALPHARGRSAREGVVLSECPVKLDSDEACLIAADWYEEQGDSQRAERMRAVLTFKFGDRVAAEGKWGARPPVVVGRDEDCLHVVLMRDDNWRPSQPSRTTEVPPPLGLLSDG